MPKGSYVYGGYPGQSSFYTDLQTLEESNYNSDELFDKLQVKPHSKYGYRTKMMKYLVIKDIKVSGGKALANNVLGAGGGNQYVIKEFTSVLKEEKLIELVSNKR